ncbi:hypothetical protein WJX77_006160 [Trebouxia sp. C0004]
MGGYARRAATGWSALLLMVLLVIIQTQSTAGQLAFDWGRPCTLVGTSSSSQVGPNCGKCGRGAMASNSTKMDCTFKDVVIPPSSSIAFSYHGDTHHLFVASSPCTYTTEICPNKSNTIVTTSRPCKYSFPASGVFYVSDKTKHYCEQYSAHLKVTVT